LPNQNLANLKMTQMALIMMMVMNYSSFHKRETFFFALTCHWKWWQYTYCNPLLNTVHAIAVIVTQFLALALTNFSQSAFLLHYCIPAMDIDGCGLLLTQNTSAMVYMKNAMSINQNSVAFVKCISYVNICNGIYLFIARRDYLPNIWNVITYSF
jgi:hypothetical protein